MAACTAWSKMNVFDYEQICTCQGCSPSAAAAKHCAWGSSSDTAETRAFKPPASVTAARPLALETAARATPPTPYRCNMGSLLLAQFIMPVTRTRPQHRIMPVPSSCKIAKAHHCNAADPVGAQTLLCKSSVQPPAKGAAMYWKHPHPMRETLQCCFIPVKTWPSCCSKA